MYKHTNTSTRSITMPFAVCEPWAFSSPRSMQMQNENKKQKQKQKRKSGNVNRGEIAHRAQAQ
jgi:hypothetical protein